MVNKKNKFMVAFKEIPNLTPQEKDRFWKKVSLTANLDSCWNWHGNLRHKQPYGFFWIKKSPYCSHRVSYFISTTTDPKGLCVLHKCDNPKCVNPEHLFLGTNSDNIADKVKKGRTTKGITPWNKGKILPSLWNSKKCNATKEQMLEMVQLYKSKKISVSQLSKKYKISRPTVSKAIAFLGSSIKKCPFSILNENKVLAIRSEYSEGKISFAKLAAKYGVGATTISHIIYRHTWKLI